MNPRFSRLRGRSVSSVALDVVRGMYRHGAVDAARLMAFNFFLSVVPLLVLLGFVLGRFVRRRGVDALVGPLFETIPDAAGDLVRHELERLAGASATPIAPVSIVTFLWLTSSGIHQMMDVFELAARAPRRRWITQRIIALGTVALGVGALSLTSWGLVTGDDALHGQDSTSDVAPVASAPAAAPSASAARPGTARSPRATSKSPAPPPKRRHLLSRVHAPWERVFAGTVVLLVGLLALAAFYRFAVEHPADVHRHAWPGAISAMAGWILVSWIFGTYIGSLGSYAVYYGGLAAVAVLLVWLFLTSLALLFGAEVNALLEGVGAHE